MKGMLRQAAAMPLVRSGRAARGGLLILLFSGLLAPAGCEDRGVRKAKQETADAKANAARLELSLARAVQEIADLKAEVKAVKQTRDELQGQIDKISRERDQALTLARQAREVITQLSTRADGQAGAAVALERQVAELKAQVNEQQKVIEDLKSAVGGARPADVSEETDANEVSPPEPNDEL